MKWTQHVKTILSRSLAVKEKRKVSKPKKNDK